MSDIKAAALKAAVLKALTDRVGEAFVAAKAELMEMRGRSIAL